MRKNRLYNRSTVAKRLFEGIDEDMLDPEFPNYGDIEELKSSVETSFNKLIMNKNSYRNEDDRMHDLELLADMRRAIIDEDDPMALSQEQRELVCMIVYDAHIHPDDLSDTELANVIVTLSNLAKLELRDYEYYM